MGLRSHFKYAIYVLRHKWFVFLACWRLGVPLWQAIVHDFSKFRPSEWFPYVNHFHGPQGDQNRAASAGKYHQPGNDEAFDRAWLRHIHRNQHHWQHYVIIEAPVPDTILSNGAAMAMVKILKITDRFTREMVADWHGAGRAQGFPDTRCWYERNKEKMALHPQTRARVEELLNKL